MGAIRKDGKYEIDLARSRSTFRTILLRVTVRLAYCYPITVGNSDRGDGIYRALTNVESSIPYADCGVAQGFIYWPAIFLLENKISCDCHDPQG